MNVSPLETTASLSAYLLISSVKIINMAIERTSEMALAKITQSGGAVVDEYGAIIEGKLEK
jgi:hypothetical protein